MQNANQRSQNSKSIHSDSDDSFHAVQTLNKKLPIGLRYLIGCSLLVLASIFVVAILHPHLSERVKFATDMSLNLLILCAIAVQAYIYTGQWQVMREQSVKIEQSFVLANRAYVCVHSIEINKAQKVVLVKVENTGNLPAGDVSLLLKLVSFGPPEGLDETDRPPTQRIKSSAVREDYGGTKLFKGNLPILLTFYLSDWTDSDFRNIEKGKDGLSLVGYIQYSDGFSNGPDERTEFCFHYQPEIGTWSAGPTEFGDVLGWGDDEAG